MNRTDKLQIEGGYRFENGAHLYQGVVIGEWKIFLPALILTALIIWLGVHEAFRWYWITAASLVVLLIGCSISRRFTIDSANRVVREQVFLYVRRTLKERVMPFADFKFIYVDRVSEGDEGQKFRVLLQHNTGRKILIKECGSQPRAAEELMWRISCDTGIKIKDAA